MKVVEDFLDNPKRSIGGAVIPIIGVPGCGKTNVLIQLALMRKNDGHKILWRGTEQGEWLKFLANGENVCVWNHESVDRVRVKKSDRHEVEKINLSEIPNVEVRTWHNPKKVISQSERDKINIINVPGVFGNGKEGRAFFTEKIIDVLEEIVRRENTYNFVDFFTDEAGDIWPCQQQLSGDQYDLVANRTPPLLSQLRKQNSFLYLAGHGTQDMHYFVWKIKSNTIGYMSNSKVKNFHTQVEQYKVNNLDRGQMIVPPKDKTKYMLAYEEEDLSWNENNSHLDLEIKDSLDERIEQKQDDKISKTEKAGVGKQVYDALKDEGLNVTQSKIAEIIDVDQSTLAQS